MATDWKLVKNEYETLGTDVKELSRSHHVSEQLILHAIEDGDWKRSDNTDTEDINSRLRAMEARHQTSLVPRFIRLQAKMLDKCDALLDAVSGLEDANSLRIVSEVIEKHRPAIMGNKDPELSDKGLTVRILSQVGSGEDVSISAVEISTTAAATNGRGGVPCGTPVN